MDPSPSTVDASVVIFVPPGPNAVEKDEIATPMELFVERSEDVKEAVEMYPADPKPVTVDVSCEVRYVLEIN